MVFDWILEPLEVMKDSLNKFLLKFKFGGKIQ